MISAFGVEHGEVSKSLKVPHREALLRVARDRSIQNWERAGYAKDRLALHGLKDVKGGGDYKGPLPMAAGYRKKFMAKHTRSTIQRREKNRKPIFSDAAVSKSFKKLEPKLTRLLRTNPDHLKTMEDKTRWNYASGRHAMGTEGKRAKTPAQVNEAKRIRGLWKEWNAAHMEGAKNISRRKGRQLP